MPVLRKIVDFAGEVSGLRLDLQPPQDERIANSGVRFRRTVAIIDFHATFSIREYGANPATAISFAGRAENEDHGVYEVELRRSRLGCDLYPTGACCHGKRAATENQR